MRQKKAPPVLPRRRTPFTRKRTVSPASDALALRTRWHLTLTRTKEQLLLRTCRHLTLTPQKSNYRVERAGTPPLAQRVNCPECRHAFCSLSHKKRPHKAAFAIDRKEGVVKPYSRSNLYKADRYRARDGRGWFPGAQALPKYAPSRSCRTNGRTSARIC